MARKLAPKRQMSRKCAIFGHLQQFPEEFLFNHEVKGDRQAVAHSGLHARQQFFQNNGGNCRHIQLSGLLDRDPGQFNQF